jgi:hypothetical protein
MAAADDSEIRTNQASQVLERLAINQEGRAIVWEYVKAFPDEILENNRLASRLRVCATQI